MLNTGCQLIIQIDGTRPWVFCADFDFRGKAALIEPGEHSDISLVISTLDNSVVGRPGYQLVTGLPKLVTGLPKFGNRVTKKLRNFQG